MPFLALLVASCKTMGKSLSSCGLKRSKLSSSLSQRMETIPQFACYKEYQPSETLFLLSCASVCNVTQQTPVIHSAFSQNKFAVDLSTYQLPLGPPDPFLLSVTRTENRRRVLTHISNQKSKKHQTH